MSSFVDFAVIKFHPRLDSTRLDPTRPRPFIFRTLQLSVSLGLNGCGCYCDELRFVRLCRPRVKSSFLLSIVLIPMHFRRGGGYFILHFFFGKNFFLSFFPLSVLIIG
jgi:hypothetical protein